jgi:hypothetical protein
VNALQACPVVQRSSQPKSVLIARAAPNPARPGQLQIVIVAENALSDYDVVNFDLSSCGGGKEGEATIEIYR